MEADPRALFLWVTDDPALNRQTRKKMIDASELLDPSRLVDLDDSFLDAELDAGPVYFLNIQQLVEDRAGSRRAARTCASTRSGTSSEHDQRDGDRISTSCWTRPTGA